MYVIAVAQWRLHERCLVFCLLNRRCAGLSRAQEACAADDTNWAAHKWLAVGYKVVSDYEGTKSKLQQAFKIRDEFKRGSTLWNRCS